MFYTYTINQTFCFVISLNYMNKKYIYIFKNVNDFRRNIYYKKIHPILYEPWQPKYQKRPHSLNQ